jgi:pyruvate/2-oxoacid:ferredoxin oxidoreductase alpha subunit
MVVDLLDQPRMDGYLPLCDIPQRLRQEHPATMGGLTWPRDTQRHRRDIQDAMERVPRVLGEAIEEFEALFGRRVAGAVETEQTGDAETIVIASSTMAATLRRVIRARRARGERVGMIRIKQFRPFPRNELLQAIGGATRVGVLDRNHSPGSGGIFWSEVAATLRDRNVLLQDYIAGIGGGDVTPEMLDAVIDDLASRTTAVEPLWQDEISGATAASAVDISRQSDGRSGRRSTGTMTS